MIKRKKITKKDLIFVKKKKNAKKGDYGKVLVIGGSLEYVNAPALSGLAALRSGSDWVTILAPIKAALSINSFSLDLITHKIDSDYLEFKHKLKILNFSKNFDAVLIGPGLGLKKSTVKLVRFLIKKLKPPIILDADALKHVKINNCNNCVLTPNQNEFEIILKNNKTNEFDLNLKIKNNILVKKGPVDLIYTKNKILINDIGSPRLAVAGSGDVLSGIILSYIGQKQSLLQSTINAVYTISKVSENLIKNKNVNFLASDIIEKLSTFQLNS